MGLEVAFVAEGEGVVVGKMVLVDFRDDVLI